MPSCRIILPSPSEASAGRPTRLGSRRRSCRETRDAGRRLAKFTGKSFDDMGEYLVRDTYMSPQEAKN